MEFHTFGNKENSAVILLHGMLTPWQIWNKAAETFSEKYYVVVPELDAHTEDVKSSFISIEDEAQKICGYIKRELNGEVFLLAGLSMGGRIAAVTAEKPDIKISHLVLDGAPLLKTNGILKDIMKKNYRNIISRSKEREVKIQKAFERDFLPAEYWDHFVRIADNMEKQSVDNIINEVFTDLDIKAYPDDMKIMFMHGTKGNESVSRKGALKMKEKNPGMEIRCYDGLAHAELACFMPDQWIREVEDFIDQ